MGKKEICNKKFELKICKSMATHTRIYDDNAACIFVFTLKKLPQKTSSFWPNTPVSHRFTRKFLHRVLNFHTRSEKKCWLFFTFFQHRAKRNRAIISQGLRLIICSIEVCSYECSWQLLQYLLSWLNCVKKIVSDTSIL